MHELGWGVVAGDDGMGVLADTMVEVDKISHWRKYILLYERIRKKSYEEFHRDRYLKVDKVSYLPCYRTNDDERKTTTDISPTTTMTMSRPPPKPC